MRRRALALLAVVAAALSALAACADEPVDPPVAAPRTTTVAPTTNPLAGFTAAERSFIQSVTAAGFTFSNGNAGAISLGEAICDDIRAGRRSALTRQELAAPGGMTAAEAEQLYTLSHRTLCSSLVLPNPNSFGTGTYEVGVDIQPGRYRSPGGESCYWARLAEDQSDIIDNNLSSGPSVFTVVESDGFVELNRCTWTLAE